MIQPMSSESRPWLRRAVKSKMKFELRSGSNSMLMKAKYKMIMQTHCTVQTQLVNYFGGICGINVQHQSPKFKCVWL